MREIRIANRYAKALFDLAREKDQLESVKQDMYLVSKTIEGSKELRVMLKSPLIKTPKKISILRSIFEGKLSQISQLFLEIITKKGREAYIGEISVQFTVLYKKFKHIITAEIISAQPLEAAFKQKVISMLKKASGAEIELIEKIEEDLIGGFILQYDFKQFDASVRTRLKNLQKEFNVNLYVRGF